MKIKESWDIHDYNISYNITQDVFIKMMKNIVKYKLENGKF